MKTLIACLIAGTLACGGSATTTTPGGTLTVAVANPELVPAQTTSASVTLNGVAIDASTATLTTTNPAVATIGPTGVIVAVAAGTTTIRASRDGASAGVTVRVFDGGIAAPSGGTIRILGGAVELVIPAGAVASPTPIVLGPGASPGVDPSLVIGSIVQVGTTPITFSVPVTLRIRYVQANGPLGLPQRELGIRVVSLAGAWTDLRSSTVDSVVSIASASITQTGTYSVGRLTPTSACTGAPHRLFDFWVGDWNVTAGGQANGRNTITIEPGGCAVFEEYVTPTAISPGRSVSFFEPNTNRWYQTYVDAGANRLVLESVSFDAASLVLKTPTIGTVYQRVTWSRQADGSVRQVIEVTANNGSTFTTVYDLLYRKR